MTQLLREPADRCAAPPLDDGLATVLRTRHALSLAAIPDKGLHSSIVPESQLSGRPGNTCYDWPFLLLTQSRRQPKSTTLGSGLLKGTRAP
jgi:hypothetical protein